jgi:signal transduction histidine kinase
MRFFRRSLIALGVAAMLPTVVFAAFSVFYLLRAERERVQTATLARSEIVMAVVDARMEGHLAGLKIVSNAPHFETRDWYDLYLRLQRVLSGNADWHTIVLIDLERGEALFDLRRPFGSPVMLSATQHESLNAAVRAASPMADRVEAGTPPVVWLYLPVALEGRIRYVMAAAVKAQVFQDLLLSLAEHGSTAAIVDREGRFIARTLDFEKRVGTPATSYVRKAIRGGPSGFYRGTTYEGLKNYTAFHTSPISGWSAHLAVASSSIDRPAMWSLVAAVAAALGGILLGAILVLLVLRDMSERRRAEEALGQSQKMEAIGQLTGGIAHDFNNLLTAIVGNLDMIRSRASGNERLQRLADNALEAARRGAKLSSQLLAFSRSQRMTVGTVDLRHMLAGMSVLLKQSVGPAVEVRVHIEPDARYVISDANQLELALLNMAVNARDAMPNGGTVTISARRTTGRERLLPKQEYVRLCVSDMGIGMSEEVRRRAVEPFFTTKPLGQGTGLGLSQVYGVARESGGSVSIDSEPGRGTTVCMILRASAAERMAAGGEAPDTAPTVPSPAVEDDLRILVVDDDRLVRRFMADGLRSLHYQVMDVDNGEEALKMLDTMRFDLLVVDFAMPGMNGADLARAAHQKLPDLPVLVVSGYADTGAVEAALGSAPQLRKPFDLAELGAAVAEILRTPVH